MVDDWKHLLNLDSMLIHYLPIRERVSRGSNLGIKVVRKDIGHPTSLADSQAYVSSLRDSSRTYESSW